MPDLSQATLNRIDNLEREVARLRNRDRAPNVLVLRDGVSLPNTAEGVAQIYIDAESGTVRIRFSNGTVYEFTTVEVIITSYLLDFSDADNSMYLGAF